MKVCIIDSRAPLIAKSICELPEFRPIEVGRLLAMTAIRAKDMEVSYHAPYEVIDNVLCHRVFYCLPDAVAVPSKRKGCKPHIYVLDKKLARYVLQKA
jgi:hypothetical protein